MLAVQLKEMFGENGYAMLVDEGCTFSLLLQAFKCELTVFYRELWRTIRPCHCYSGNY